ncbi:MAG: Holliday junction resolvase-like protein [archaeon]|nr:Holliday junction resolvase-like protein [archaeon]
MKEILIIFVLIVAVVFLFMYIVQIRGKLRDALSRKQSQSTRYGQIFEQLVPFSKDFPFDPKKFRFIGNPIDGIVFEDDKITFCEIKLNNSALSARQKSIKKMIDDKKVYWREIRG